MRRFLYVLFALAFLSITANAATSVNIGNTNCAGNLTTLLLDGASFSCSGDFTLTDGFVTSDTFIHIFADGNLFINHLNLTAPKITLSNSSGMLAIGRSAVLNAGANITLNSGATVTLNSDYISIAKGAELTLIQDGKILLTPNPLLVIQPGGNIELGSADNITFSSPVPETSTYVMILLGLGLISFRFRAKKS